jgi:hypothetical protein
MNPGGSYNHRFSPPQLPYIPIFLMLTSMPSPFFFSVKMFDSLEMFNSKECLGGCLTNTLCPCYLPFSFHRKFFKRSANSNDQIHLMATDILFDMS